MAVLLPEAQIRCATAATVALSRLALANRAIEGEAMPDTTQQARRELIAKIERRRKSKVIAYLTSLRQGVPAQMSEDAVRQLMNFLLRIKKRPVPRLDLFLASNGGNSVVPWRLVALMREYATEFNVLIPYRAYSAATILSLGADNIVMHPFAEMGPIDPTVSNDYNPIEGGTNRRLGISVEDVKAYVTFVKTTVGITEQQELGHALQLLASQVHPLALGNVERFLSQSRLVGKKILQTHMGPNQDAIINEIIENLASKLFFHGHPINRREARDHLQLKVIDPDPQLEADMWSLYEHYEAEFDGLKPFNPITTFNWHRAQAASMGQPTAPMSVDLAHAVIEDRTSTTWYRTSRVYTELVTHTPQGVQQSLKEDLLTEGWTS